VKKQSSQQRPQGFILLSAIQAQCKVLANMRHEQQIILTTPLDLDKLIYHLIDIVAGNLGFFGYCQVVKQSLHRGIWLEQSFRAPPEPAKNRFQYVVVCR
jgi:hypothetical protein